MARYAPRPWREGDPVPQAGEVVLVSGVNQDIESDQDRSYSLREVLAVTDDRLFIVMRTKGCWPTVERLENCWFADPRWPIVDRLEDLFRKAHRGSPALDVEVWGLCCAKPLSLDPKKAGVKPPAFTTDLNAALWLLCYLFPGDTAGAIRSDIAHEAMEEATNAFWTSERDNEPYGVAFAERWALEISQRCVRAVVANRDDLRDTQP